MAITKIHAVKVRLGDAINYIENPDKTDGQELISGYNTAPQTAVLDFSVTAAMARKARNTSAKNQGNLAYHLIQSFSPDDAVTPERAHELGRKLATEFTDGKFEFVVATHINKDSIQMVLQHFSGYIASLSMRKLYDERGNVYYGVDEDIRERLQARLMRAILTFRAE